MNYTFASDNAAGICPEAWAALEEANRGAARGYGDDPWTARARSALQDIFETECEVFFVFNGTAANCLSLAAICRPFESVFCHESSHVQTDECAAPEFFTGGSKLIPLPGEAGKIDLDSIAPAAARGHGIHHPKPGALTLTQATEWGAVYRPSEVAALHERAHAHGMRLHMDGARFANAVAALGGRHRHPADLTWRAGVDVLSLGGTKNGMLNAEAVLFFKPGLAQQFAYRVKQGAQLASKMRYAAAQWVGMLAGDAWLRHAAHANRQAARLARGLRDLPGLKLLREPEANAVFLEIPSAAAAALLGNWGFYPFFGENGYRLMCSWATTDADIDAFLADAEAALSR